MRALRGGKLPVVDDWALEQLRTDERHEMLEIVEDRYGRAPR
jgi:hypothetical protein